VKIFYTYMWLREDGTPYYVGKGYGTRAWRRGCPPHDRIIVQESEDEAVQAEIFLIAFYGRKDKGTGILHNFTDGGEGTSGRKWTEDQRRKFKLNASKAWEARKARGEVHKFPPEVTARGLAAANKARSDDPEHWKQGISKAQNKSWTAERKREQASRLAKQREQDPELASRAGLAGAVARWGG